MKSTHLRNLFFNRAPAPALYAGILVGCLSLGAGCSDDADSGAKEGESCTLSKECQTDLVCRNQQCVPARTGNNSDNGDPNNDNDGGTQPDENITAADYYISYELENKNTNAKVLHVYSTADGEKYQIGDEERSCERGCWLTEDMKYFAWAKVGEDSSQGLDLFAVEVVDFEPQGEGSLVASGVSGISAAGNGMTYNKAGNAYYLSLGAGGGERAVAPLGGEESDGGWYFDPSADVALSFATTLDTLELKVGPFENPDFESIYTFNSVNFAGGAGSHYGTSMPVAVSPDGKLMAFVLKAPNDYQECASSSDCDGPVKICGSNNFCSVLELTVHFLDMDNLGNLGEECSSASDCGDIHQCYQPGGESPSECIPGRAVVGIPDMPFQRTDSDVAQATPRSGCTISADDPTYHYTFFGGPVSFDNSGNLYGVASRDCSDEGAVGDSDIIKINSRSKDYEVVWGNPDTGFDPDQCWDDGNQAPDVSQCSPYITEALVSPDGNDIAFAATNPYIDREDFAKSNFDLWRVLRNGKRHDWIGGHGISETVQNIAVHPAP